MIKETVINILLCTSTFGIAMLLGSLKKALRRCL